MVLQQACARCFLVNIKISQSNKIFYAPGHMYKHFYSRDPLCGRLEDKANKTITISLSDS